MIDDIINYARIGTVQTYYSALGYWNIEVPWAVSFSAVKATLPSNRHMFQCPIGVLVGSGEQSFIEFMLRNQFKPGKYQCTTPCWRDEDEYNELTRVSFMKTELIWYMPEDPQIAFQTVLQNVLNCFFEISEIEQFDIVKTEEGQDIFLNGIELGSYGMRKMGEHTWIYGTGLAEPRFSVALNRQRQIGSMALAAIKTAESLKSETEEPQETTELVEENS